LAVQKQKNGVEKRVLGTSDPSADGNELGSTNGTVDCTMDSTIVGVTDLLVKYLEQHLDHLMALQMVMRID